MKAGRSKKGANSRDRILQAALQEFAIPGERLCFEITETAAITDLPRTLRFMHRFKRLGCRFALDDFGSGVSSYAYLKSLPVDFVKIDGAFVKDMADDAIDRAMVKSINEVAHVMGTSVGTAKSHLSRGRDRLRDLLGERP